MKNLMSQLMHSLEMQFKHGVPKIADAMLLAVGTQYKLCIDAFYGHWGPPVYYKRKGPANTNYLAFSKTNSSYSFYSTKTGRYGSTIEKNLHVTIRFFIDSSLIGDPYDDPSDYVFYRTFARGIHGTLRQPQMSPSPLEMFNSYINGETGEIQKDCRFAINRGTLSVGLGSLL